MLPTSASDRRSPGIEAAGAPSSPDPSEPALLPEEVKPF